MSPEISEIEIKTVETVEITGNSVIVFRYNAVEYSKDQLQELSKYLTEKLGSRFILISKDIDILKIEKG